MRVNSTQTLKYNLHAFSCCTVVRVLILIMIFLILCYYMGRTDMYLHSIHMEKILQQNTPSCFLFLSMCLKAS